ncbi:hypothetical protein L249_2979 [Ophiocordyceps polyrhachis-furcata BCC 54312]|uniref:Uncharacterized protein n=1 Tax=Ophiocordyceps polyrhachis-furcata BCC 54312 TaxID=1330021 RepID=A0A367LNE9_9HYPO|nr:hypothetical protein L249_2979 [Ophiocordyceps polyrhachis-furcata BCC 54312]
MAPLTPPFPVDAEAVSGICGQALPPSASLGHGLTRLLPLGPYRLPVGLTLPGTVVVFSPQIIQQFRQGNADGLSLQFIAIWLLGDTILAIYYTLADLVLLSQCFYYRVLRRSDDEAQDADERTPLCEADWTGLSPAVGHQSTPEEQQARPSRAQTAGWNATVIAMVCCAGAAGWLLAGRKGEPSDDRSLELNVAGQVFGYLCAVAYMASRVPQLLLNWRRKTTDGLSMLFFLFACLGNATYVLSILSYEPRGCVNGLCEPGAVYGRHVLVNLSWLMGSAVTLLMDLIVLVQHLVYRAEEDEEGEGEEEEEEDGDDDDGEVEQQQQERQQHGRRGVRGQGSWQRRPILERGDTDDR